ncbi:hypothetical protein KVR01_010076 [Diaporthe batatas]|uniref:uncharacterized protein n=1 Tax=Diaporthe batatas TaxID=748121 RepID=UPI001D0590E8|nr:uncharacterized protein KVR01_010076 [Diaporthe batatas]KAG8160540.1 hypothetical protein KVR01_010076 [Diaporthe batatas]
MNPPEDAPTAIRGNFIPVSGPSIRPASPTCRRRPDFGLHVHLNITDPQMEQLASSLPGYESPGKRSRDPHNASSASDTIQIGISPRRSNTGSRGSHERDGARARARARDISPTRAQPSASNSHRSRRRAPMADVVDASFSSTDQPSRSRSPGKRSESRRRAPALTSDLVDDDSYIADRVGKLRPPPIDVETARQYGPLSNKAVVVQGRPHTHSLCAVVNPPVTPPLRRMPKLTSPRREPSSVSPTSSYYSEDELGQARPSYISPLRVREDLDADLSVPRCHDVRTRSPYPNRAKHDASPARLISPNRGLQKTATTGDLHELRSDETFPQRTYSPLSDYLSVQAKPIRKQLVGAHGWLERTSGAPGKQHSSDQGPIDKAPTQKKGGFLDSLRKMAKEMTTSAKDITSSASRKPRERDNRGTRLTVSLDPREQSLLYCELEFLLTTALDGYISSQFNAGRLDADKYKKIVDGWQQRGRPKVIGFRYDLETQLDLILLHSEDFRFYGKRAGLIAAVNGVLDMMRVDARAMRIRTFCQPDTVIAKQLLDSQSLFNLVGCCEQQQIQLAEVIQFFKVVLEREQSFRLRQNEGGTSEARGSGGSGTASHYEQRQFHDQEIEQ